MKLKSSVNILIVIVLLNVLTTSYGFDCDQQLGCLLKKKFFAYVSNADTRGVGHSTESNINFKNIFVFRDKIVFYKASLPQENVSEQEVPGLNPQMNEAHIERLISFRYLNLQCGKYETRICHASELPQIAKSEAYKTVKAKIANSSEKCIAFTFFDEAYPTEEQKIAILCITDARQVKDLLAFKNFLSRKVAGYHLYEAVNRYDSSSGIEISNGHYISYINNKPTPVYASIREKSILLATDDTKRDYLTTIKLLGLRNSGAYSLRKASELKKLKDGWSDSLSSPPPLDCCLALPSEERISLLCIPNGFKKKEIEVKKEKCASAMQRTLKTIWTELRKIQFAEKLSILVTDLRVSGNCNSPEYKIFKNMIIDSGRTAINTDCKILMQYSPDLFMTKKDYCLKHYVDEIEMMIKLIVLGNKRFWNSLKDCTYKQFGLDFSDNFILCTFLFKI